MKAVYYICNEKYGHVSYKVWENLESKGYFNKSGITFCGKEVMMYKEKNNTFYFVPTDLPLCLDYPKYLPDMNKYFSDCDMSAMVTWHEGEHAPSNVLTVHSLGDLDSATFGNINPRFMRNLLINYEKNRKELGLNDYTVRTEATHWSGVHNHKGDPSLLLNYKVPMVDIEIGSDESSWNNTLAIEALTRTLLNVFDDDNKIVHNILCIGGVHFEPSFADSVFTTWGNNNTFGVSHIMANQWLVTGKYEENGFEKAIKCVNSIEGGIEAIFIHDKLKGCYKDVARQLGDYYKVPVYKHQKLREPNNIEWKK